jgi:hypothetical protein
MGTIDNARRRQSKASVAQFSRVRPPHTESPPVSSATLLEAAAVEFCTSRREVGAEGRTAGLICGDFVQVAFECPSITFDVGASARNLPCMPAPKDPSRGPKPTSNLEAAAPAPIFMLTASESFPDCLLPAAREPSSRLTQVPSPTMSAISCHVKFATLKRHHRRPPPSPTLVNRARNW